MGELARGTISRDNVLKKKFIIQRIYISHFDFSNTFFCKKTFTKTTVLWLYIYSIWYISAESGLERAIEPKVFTRYQRYIIMFSYRYIHPTQTYTYICIYNIHRYVYIYHMFIVYMLCITYYHYHYPYTSKHELFMLSKIYNHV